MEGKRPLDDTLEAHDSRPLSHVSSPRHFTPRLPTPEASRLSDTSCDERTLISTKKRGPSLTDLLSSFSSSNSSSSSDEQQQQHQHQQQQQRLRALNDKSFTPHFLPSVTMPRSPPYGSSDEQRQLLPPLRMVIANAMNSPPETPRVEGASLQPSPREPSVSSTTFKPLAFYPNKKARVEDCGAVPYRQSNKLATSPASAFPALERHQYSQQSLASEEASQRHRRHSMHPSYGSGRYDDRQHYDDRPSWSKGYASEPSWDAINRPSMSRDRHPMSPGPEYAFRPDTSHSVSYAGHNRRPSSSHHPQRPAYEMHRNPSEDSQRYESYDSRGRYEHERPSYHPRRDSYDTEQRSGASQNPSSSYFMPAHYDYTQSKTRKRSNLPKQSTEIMKTWFDNNISNPYPSEEQKARFSSLTGISMTQVSNWFINHRRRCPELREKRERVGRGGDVE